MTEPAEQIRERQRSPQCPTISLGDAVTRIKTLYKEDKGAPATMQVMAQHLDFSPKSSGFLQCLASLKRFGLLDDIEGPGERRMKLTPLALDIVLLPEVDPRWGGAIKKAALLPKVFRGLWALHGSNLPSDANLLHGLISTQGFKHDAAEEAIQVYKKTIAFAQLKEGDTIKGSPENKGEKQPNEPREDDMPSATAEMERQKMYSAKAEIVDRVAVNVAVSAKVVRDFAVPLDDGNAIIVRVPLPLSEEDFETLIGTLSLWKKKLTGATLQRPTPPNLKDDSPAKIEMNPT